MITPYNNKPYRISLVDFDSNPRSTFETHQGPKSYSDYYRERYNINIRDNFQPLLIAKQSGDKRGEEVRLIPELCNFTGLTNDMLGNFQLNKKRTEVASVKPSKRIEEYLKIIDTISKNEKNMNILDTIKASIDTELV